ncbi:HAMP domain-containing sensor histidine kinase [Clostridium sp. SHJSY1]|uniref:sensor histidine kinase n=1 Tax=Clostridium sp. SHJSY1 TaxID=2942483 RepID=UPI00287B9917|nr:HAMP domain-containing sensor histidine kinase [Clostridium sp. SHJSY1]
MAIKLKNRLKKYISQIWLVEIVVVTLICAYFGAEIYKVFLHNSSSKVITAIEATLHPKEYYGKALKSDSFDLVKIVYDKTNSFQKVYYGNEDTVNIIKKNFIYKYYEKEGYSNAKGIYFIVRNKNTNEIITNDSSQYLDVPEAQYTDENIRLYISEKYNGKDLVLSYDNENKFNNLVEEEGSKVDKNILGNYQEYYYTSLDNYTEISNWKIVFYSSILFFIGIFLFIKILVVFIINKKNTIINGNFVYSIIYVLKHGFKYKQTRRTLIAAIICSSILFVVYLYLLAIGREENNIIVTFFKKYPFKGSVLLMVLPMIGIMYSIKKTIEISMVNDSLKKINEGELNYHIVEQGGPEILELIQNITKIKSGYEIAVEETLKNEKLKTELISNVSHDLRTPLTSIINYVNILKSPDITEEEGKEYIMIVEQKSKRLKVLIDDLFEMSKINSGKIQLNKENIDIMSLIHQAVGEYSYLYEEKNIEFKVNCEVEEIDMDLDGKMISRVIENIVINALKYSLENTRVYIDVLDEDDNVEIAFKNVANYDMNFDNNDIFERFARGDSSRNSNVEGSGLGLAIAKSIIELHKGNISIIREGDMFKIYITLPKGNK